MHTYIHTRIHTYIHTYTHTYKYTHAHIHALAQSLTQQTQSSSTHPPPLPPASDLYDIARRVLSPPCPQPGKRSKRQQSLFCYHHILHGVLQFRRYLQVITALYFRYLNKSSSPRFFPPLPSNLPSVRRPKTVARSKFVFTSN